MRLGWLQDPETEIVGGAELSCRELLAHVPDGIEVVPCPAGAVDPTCDEYAIFNCFSYGIEIIGQLRGKPIVKFVYDVWPHGDARVRDWLLREARVVVMQTPLQRAAFEWKVTAPVVLMPPAMDLSPFRRPRNSQSAGTLWLGRIHVNKGVLEAIEWAKEHGPVDFYGAGGVLPPEPNVRHLGQVPPDEVPALLSRYEKFLFLPREVDPCPRSVFEAWAAGCELVVNERVGSMYWIREHPDEVESGAARFWELFE